MDNERDYGRYTDKDYEKEKERNREKKERERESKMLSFQIYGF